MNLQLPLSLNNCSLETVRSMVERTTLAKKCVFLYETTNIHDISRGFRQLIDATSVWEIEQWQPIFTSVCLLYLVNYPTDPMFQMRGKLITRILHSSFIDCLDPMKVHELVDYLLDRLSKQDVYSHSNILHLSLALSSYSWRGRPLAVCLLWAVIGGSLQLEITMHRYRELNELAVAIGKEQNFVLAEKTSEELQKFVLLLFAINKLIVLLLFTDNKELHAAGYPKHFFQMERTDVESIRNWFMMLLVQYKTNREHSNIPYAAGIKITQSLESSIHLFDNIQGTEEPTKEQQTLDIFKVNQDTYSDLSDEDV